jgi:hypothetical protein
VKGKRARQVDWECEYAPEAEIGCWMKQEVADCGFHSRNSS